jgi:orotate phosphoribosyltransferase
MEYEEKIARVALEIEAIKLSPDDPFTWTSGFRMPIYNNNRRFIFDPKSRFLIAKGFEAILDSEKIPHSIIAGTSTAGISPATTLADLLYKNLIYVRDKPKVHGLKTQIEGINSESDLDGERVVLIEDLISTGGSSARAVQAIRDANGICDNCFSVFNYGFEVSQKRFVGEIPYGESENRLNHPCNVISLLTYDKLLEVAKETGYIDSQQVEMLREWREDPFRWGEKHGFPKVEK